MSRIFFILSFFVFQIISFPYYIEFLWRITEKNCPHLAKDYNKAKVNYIERNASYKSLQTFLKKLPPTEKEFFHYFKLFINRYFSHGKIDLFKPSDYNQIQSENNFLAFCLHVTQTEKKLGNLKISLKDCGETVQGFDIYISHLLEMMDSLTILFKYDLIISSEQKKSMIQNVYELVQLSYKYLAGFKISHSLIVHQGKPPYLMESPHKIILDHGKDTFSSKVLLLGTNLRFAHCILKSMTPDLNFIDHINILYHQVSQYQAVNPIGEFLKSAVQNHFQKKLKEFRRELGIKDDLKSITKPNMYSLLENLFDSTFFGIPFYFYPTDGMELGDNILMSIWDLLLRSNQINSFIAHSYDFDDFSTVMSCFLTKLHRYHSTLQEQGFVSTEYKTFYVECMSPRIMKIYNLWHSNDQMRIKLINLVGCNGNSCFRLKGYEKWLSWVESQLEENSPQSQILLATLNEAPFKLN